MNKKLSIWRLSFAILAIAVATAGIVWSVTSAVNKSETKLLKPWFAPYVDITATPSFGFEQSDSASVQKNVVLAFVVASKNDGCDPSWGNAYTLEQAKTTLDLDRRIARFRQRGGSIIISFGGQLNDELAITCQDETKLKNAYQKVIDQYTVDTVDFDLEGNALSDGVSLKRRSEAISSVQEIFRKRNKKLKVWLTLPVSPQGLTNQGIEAVSQAIDSGVDLEGINVMTMDYGASKEAKMSMGTASKEALAETARQLVIIYKRAGIDLTSNEIWMKIGATPMIGQNDVPEEIFSLNDAKSLNQFAQAKGLKRISMWSANRDNKCSENYADVSIVSDSCSGINQEKFKFAKKLGQGLVGRMDNQTNMVFKKNGGKIRPDDPQKSPYQIWSDQGTYLAGTKVVWHQNVYLAKWWTKGDLPDSPVLQSWQTPWKLIGPVLPGEKPIPQPTLPKGTYPEWSGKEIYEENSKVLFNGIPYQSKWWTQGDSPAASMINPDSSPWIPLSQGEIELLLKDTSNRIK